MLNVQFSGRYGDVYFFDTDGLKGAPTKGILIGIPQIVRDSVVTDDCFKLCNGGGKLVLHLLKHRGSDLVTRVDLAEEIDVSEYSLPSYLNRIGNQFNGPRGSKFFKFVVQEGKRGRGGYPAKYGLVVQPISDVYRKQLANTDFELGISNDVVYNLSAIRGDRFK